MHDLAGPWKIALPTVLQFLAASHCSAIRTFGTRWHEGLAKVMKWRLIGFLLLNTLGTVISHCSPMDRKIIAHPCHAVKPCVNYCKKKKCRPGVCIKKTPVNNEQ
ncbi:unnamed protein product [Cylicocyclus nassatus]|uniref:Uncharacterized protein n=1 Tax=Cylicocyclus nassatus TaxID=53992 RepID=A0AA36DSW6_CYLNA|nr:unnamed protein product [Cylicocyclus nassatus]